MKTLSQNILFNKIWLYITKNDLIRDGILFLLAPFTWLISAITLTFLLAFIFNTKDPKAMETLARATGFLAVPIMIGILSIFKGVMQNNNYEQLNLFNDKLIKGFQRGLITSQDDLIDIHESIYKFRNKESLKKDLRLFKAMLISDDYKSIFQVDKDKVKEWLETLKGLIDLTDDQDEIPFQKDLLLPEKSVIEDLHLFIKSNNLEGSQKKLFELVGIIQAKENQLKRALLEAKISVPLAVASIIITVALSIILYVLQST